jgi:predicted Zn-ribbon and HTH transcriptional regulator
LFEDTLYKCRLAFTDAIAEYDSVCRQHDSEMDVIRPALAAKFGVVPLLDTYRQAAIRHQKAKNLREALWWAERGIALYGDIPAKPEMLFDLNKRATAYRAKLDPLTDTVPAEPLESKFVVMESLTCQTCGGSFERKRARGRKPLACPACRQTT